jgi:two-component system, cell cycle sensor histidine kinase and response regulator CckA
MRILVVDDEPSVRAFVTEVLRGAGYETVVAADGEQALNVLGHIDLLLTDLMMPRMTGDVLAVKMFTKQPTLKVLYLTAYSEGLFKKKVHLWNTEALLDKPVTAEELLDAVDLLLNGHVVSAR